MSEFVEEDIEGLLPVFETLRDVQLLSPTEIDAFVKRCHFFEYRLQKPRKDPSSFKGYTDYLGSIMKLVRMRRKRLKYRFREDKIEGKIIIKVANLRQCCERFQEEKMYIRCSQAYFRAMQVSFWRGSI
ncbi:unnamed protein product [Wuchereria bancrofti]|uniref:U3 small nucleolar RNA-associated protein 6 N-terminal domain-containing protein n=1 Tax=Wuchereria bancrofti TaxID=6293 RepID=A0A3P7DQR4_WUCBA|nr:unnamed protein product [Wuchereria bancrofti]